MIKELCLTAGGVGVLIGVGAVVPSMAAAQTETPSVLIVSAHPDDDGMYAAAIYRIARELGGAVDLALITDGSGGFRYSALAEPIYGLDLTDERVARQHLPAIRKRELMAGGAIVGIRNYFFFDELDDAYTENIDTIMTHVWHADRVRTRLQELMKPGSYDYVFVHLPRPNWHAHHKAAAILALEAAASVPADRRPVVLGSFVGAKGDTSLTGFVEHPGYPITRVRPGGPHFLFDRTRPIDETGRLNYHIVVNWLISEHKSQGVLQLLLNGPDMERFWYFATNDPARFEETARFFGLINRR